MKNLPFLQITVQMINIKTEVLMYSFSLGTELTDVGNHGLNKHL